MGGDPANNAPATGRKREPRRVLSQLRSGFTTLARSLRAELRRLDFTNTTMLMGAMLLLAVLPFLILLNPLLGRSSDAELARHIGLNGQASRAMSRLFQASKKTDVTAVCVAVVVAFLGMVGLAGSIQAVYERVFRIPHRGSRDLVRAFIWTVVLCGALLAEGEFSRWLRHAPARPVVQGLLVFAGVIVFSLWTMHFLLAGRVAWSALVPAAVTTAVCWIGLDLLDSTYFSSAMVSDSRVYGSIGAVFDLATWFIAVAAVVVLGPVLATAWRGRRDHQDQPSAPD